MFFVRKLLLRLACLLGELQSQDGILPKVECNDLPYRDTVIARRQISNHSRVRIFVVTKKKKSFCESRNKLFSKYLRLPLNSLRFSKEKLDSTKTNSILLILFLRSRCHLNIPFVSSWVKYETIHPLSCASKNDGEAEIHSF